MRRAIYVVFLLLLAAPVSAQQFGSAVAAGDDELFAAAGGNRISAGTVYVYRKVSDGSWTESGQIQASDATDMPDGFGQALASSDGILVVGAPTSGAAYVFEQQANGSWTQVSRLSGNPQANFGSAVAVSGDVLLVGAPGNAGFGGFRRPGQEPQEERDIIFGSVYAYHRTVSGAWDLAGMLEPEAVDSTGRYGSSVAVQGHMALVGAPMAASMSGAVYAFHRGDDGWISLGQVANPSNGTDRFGTSLWVSNSRAVVGAPGGFGGGRFRGGGGGATGNAVANNGSANVFEFNGEVGQWEFVTRLSPFSGTGRESFGSSIAMVGDDLWVGASGAGNGSGSVFVFHPSDMMHSFNGASVLPVEGIEGRAAFGGTIAAGSDFVAVGATGYDSREGAAIMFNRSGSAWEQANAVYNDDPLYASITGGTQPCEDSDSAGWRCDQVDMLSFLSPKDMGVARGASMNDIWGWTDPQTGHEWALVGHTDGMSFVDVTDPMNPIYVGKMDRTPGAPISIWRDMKVYKDHMFVVADGAEQHGMQVFDLHRLRNVQDMPVEFEPDYLYTDIASSHNIVINEDSGFAYAVGNRSGGITCGGGLHMIDIRDPKHPVFAGCFAHEGTGRQGRGETHDAQCVMYHGPDADYAGQEICLGSNETALSIADVTDKKNPTVIAQATYPDVGYTHQGWFTEDQRYFYVNDETDEPQGFVEGTRTLIFDLVDLDDPVLIGSHISTETSTDHNLYVRGNLMYQSNYVAGLRVLDISDPQNPVEVGFFDTVTNDNAGGGSWSNYPYFESGTIIVTSSHEGLFMLKKKQIDT